jgi:hypothetical protein
MKGLYCTGKAVTNQHIHYLLSRYRDTSMVVDNAAAALACLEGSDYELLLLEYEETGFFSLDHLTVIATNARRLSPCCVIILYWHYAPVSTGVHNTLPKSLFDLCISSIFNMAALSGTIDILKRRRYFFSRQGQATPPINGIMLGIGPGLHYLYHARLSRMGFDIILTENIDILEKNIDALQPDFFYSHCHTPRGDFSGVKSLCQRIRAHKPDCNIFITISWGVDDHYKSQHQLEAYGYNHLINMAIPIPELISLIFAGEAKKYPFVIPS